jgi:hypothetical protein
MRPIIADRIDLLYFDRTEESRHCWMGKGGLPAARGSARTASHRASGIGSFGAASPAGAVSASRASFSICFGEGIRQLAGRSFVMGHENITRTDIQGIESRQRKKIVETAQA